MTRDDGYTRYTVRIPTPLYERVKEAAGEKSVNAEIVAVLEEKFPPAIIDLDIVTRFLEGIVGGTLDDDHDAYIAEINHRLATTRFPFTVVPDGDGGVRFLPYATRHLPPEVVKGPDEEPITVRKKLFRPKKTQEK